MQRRPRTQRPATAAAALLALLATTVVGAPSTAVAAAVQRERVVLGTSVEGRPIVAVHRWRPGATRSVVVIGSMHGDERAGTRVVRRLQEGRIPDGTDLWLVRTMNPDGAAADRRTNAHGVDLNRNFPRFWVPAGAGSPTWSGPRAASEPETVALLRFLRDLRPRTTLVLHQPLNGVDAYRAKSMPLVRTLSRETGLPVRSFDCTGGCHGTLTDWHNDRTPGRAVTVELGRTVTYEQVRRVARGILRVATPS
jgi:predicted deacylase